MRRKPPQAQCQATDGTDLLPEKHKGNQRGGNDLKVIEQRSIRRRGERETEKQEDGCQDVQHDHGKGIGQVCPGDPFLGALPPAECSDKRNHAHAQPRADVKKSRHQGRGHIVKQQLGKG